MKILVIGDSCKDVFIYGTANRLCPEAPVPVFIPKRKTETGGMAENVYENIQSLGIGVDLITNQEVITKTRYVEEKTNHQIIRVDSDASKSKRIEGIEHIPYSDYCAVIISDYNKGFLDSTDLWNIGHLAKFSILDTKRKLTPDIANKFSFIKLNESEFKNNKHLNPKNIIVTLGSKGACYGGEIIPQENPQQTIDVSGAGDTFVAAFVLKFFETLEERPSIEYANKMASIVVSRRGVVTP